MLRQSPSNFLHLMERHLETTVMKARHSSKPNSNFCNRTRPCTAPHFAQRLTLALAMFLAWGALGVPSLRAAVKPDLSKLPPPAANKVDFDRDIRPIFDRACFRCHGPEKPKAGFRLDDRDRALKGGEGGVSIIPGNSQDSTLIHYVARLVEDMEMPPTGKGDPLTTAEISLMRAWIDQGATWGRPDVLERYTFNLTPAVGFVTVKGNEAKFREHQWRPEGFDGGLFDYDLQERFKNDDRLKMTARASRDQYRVTLDLDRPDLGGIHAGWEQFRKYYQDTGGYQPLLSPDTYQADRDLYLDQGRAWIDFVWSKAKWPKLTLGYEYQYRDGTKALTSWGTVADSTRTTNNIYPTWKDIRESVHIVKLDLDHEIHGVRVENRFRGQFYDLKTDRHGVTLYDPTGPGITSRQDVYEGTRHFHGANALRLEKQFKDWLFGSAGYLYSKLDGESAVGLTGTYWSFGGAPLDGSVISQEIILERQSHVANVNALLGPWQGLTFTAGAQSEWTRQSGFGRAQVETGFLSTENDTMNANSDRQQVQEHVALRFTKIPRTQLFAEARLRQDSTSIYEEQTGGIGVGYDFLRDTDIAGELKDWRTGFSTSPWTSVTFGGHYRRKDYSDDFKHRRDEAFGFPNSGYSAFIRERQSLTDEIEARCAIRFASWLKTTLTYRWNESDYYTVTDPETLLPGSLGGGLYSGAQNAQTASLNVSLTPWRRLHLSSTFTYRHTRTTTFQDDIPSIVPFRGDLYSMLNRATYVLTETMDLTGGYTYSRSDYGQSNYLQGLPVGLDYDLHGAEVGWLWRFRKNVSWKLQYGFYSYDERNTGGWNNYVAHAIFAMVHLKFP